MQSQAMAILKEQGGALNVVETLELLPDTLPMHILTPWLTQALQDAVHQSRHMAITTKLYQMENLRVKANNAGQPRFRHAGCRTIDAVHVTIR